MDIEVFVDEFLEPDEIRLVIPGVLRDEIMRAYFEARGGVLVSDAVTRAQFQIFREFKVGGGE